MSEVLKKRRHVFLGASGSGKTELSLNFAMDFPAKSNEHICFFDMDQTKGLFRSRDFFETMSARGIETVDTFNFQDAPIVPAGITSKLSRDDVVCIFDVGGNSAGAVMIGQYTGRMSPETTNYYYVINPCRPFADTAEDIEQGMVEILTASRIQPEWIQVVSNPNMGRETTADLILARHKRLEEQLSTLDMRPAALCVRADLAEQVSANTEVPVIPLQTYLSRLY